MNGDIKSKLDTMISEFLNAQVSMEEKPVIMLLMLTKEMNSNITKIKQAQDNFVSTTNIRLARLETQLDGIKHHTLIGFLTKNKKVLVSILGICLSLIALINRLIASWGK